MKLEYLDDITDGGKNSYADPDKLIRLYSFDREEVEKLVNIIQYWIIKMKESVDVSALAFVQPLNCSLKFEISRTDIGIDPSPERKFVCMLSLDGYGRMVSLLDTFSDLKNEMNGYNWLYEPGNGKIDLLFSPGGTW
jgi:hypothetical protein